MKSLLIALALALTQGPVLAQSAACSKALMESMVRLNRHAQPCVEAMNSRAVAAILCPFTALMYSVELELYPKSDIRKLCPPEYFFSYRAHLIQMRDYYKLEFQY